MKSSLLVALLAGFAATVVGQLLAYGAVAFFFRSTAEWPLVVGGTIGFALVPHAFTAVALRMRATLRPLVANVALGAGAIAAGLLTLIVPWPEQPCPGCRGELVGFLTLASPAAGVLLVLLVLSDPAMRRLTGRCPRCDGVLRTLRSQQCPHCLHEWRSGHVRPLREA